MDDAWEISLNPGFMTLSLRHHVNYTLVLTIKMYKAQRCTARKDVEGEVYFTHEKAEIGDNSLKRTHCMTY